MLSILKNRAFSVKVERRVGAYCFDIRKYKIEIELFEIQFINNEINSIVFV